MKTVDEIYGEMLAAFADRSGMELAQGCDLAVRMYAVAAQVEALYHQSRWAVAQCFPQTAQGEYLDLHAGLRAIQRRPAAKAEGTLRFYAGETGEMDREIPVGTVAMTAGLVRVQTAAHAVCKGGQAHVDVPARAVEPGEAGNVAAGAVVSMAVPPTGIVRCANLQPFTGGTDREGDEPLRQRVLDSFRRMPNGANEAFYEQEALSFDRVAAVAVVPRSRGIGTVDVVVATPGGSPGQELLAELQRHVQMRREIAVDVVVRAPQTVPVPVTVRVKGAKAGTAERVAAAVQDWFGGQRLGKSVLRAQLGALIYGCEGVENYAIDAPAQDVAVARDVLPVLESLTVGEL